MNVLCTMAYTMCMINRVKRTKLYMCNGMSIKVLWDDHAVGVNQEVSTSELWERKTSYLQQWNNNQSVNYIQH